MGVVMGVTKSHKAHTHIKDDIFYLSFYSNEQPIRE